jgi:DNA-binding transcriptional MerR regulator
MIMTWKDTYRRAQVDWSLDEFVAAANGELDNLDIEKPGDEDEAFRISPRLVRYYAQVGALDEPGRSSEDARAARYSYRHLVQLLVIRRLLNEGWPLRKVAAYVNATPLNRLEGLLPDTRDEKPGRQPTAAEQAIGDIADELTRPGWDKEQLVQRALNPKDAKAAMMPFAASRASRELLAFDEKALRYRSRLEPLWRELGHGDTPPEWQERLSIDLAPWCTVTLDPLALKKAPAGAAELLGEALTEALKAQRRIGRERK